MKPSYADKIDKFVNAMQLCIRSVIKIWRESENLIDIGFDSIEAGDERLKKIKRLLPLEKEYPLGFKIKSDYFQSEDCKKLTTFLLLTRLEERNIRKLAELDSGYASFLDKLGLKEERVSHIHHLEEAVALVFTNEFVKHYTLSLRGAKRRSNLPWLQMEIATAPSGPRNDTDV